MPEWSQGRKPGYRDRPATLCEGWAQTLLLWGTGPPFTVSVQGVMCEGDLEGRDLACAISCPQRCLT